MKYKFEIEFANANTTIDVILHKYGVLLCSFTYDGIDECICDEYCYCKSAIRDKLYNKLFKRNKSNRLTMTRFCLQLVADNCKVTRDREFWKNAKKYK